MKDHTIAANAASLSRNRVYCAYTNVYTLARDRISAVSVVSVSVDQVDYADINSRIHVKDTIAMSAAGRLVV